MTRRERVIRAIKHEQTDIVPYYLEFTDTEHQRVASYLENNYFIDDAGSHIDMLGFNGFRIEKGLGSGWWQDDFGIEWDYRDAENDVIDIHGSIMKEPRMSTYKMPQLNENKLRQMYEKLANNGRDTFKMLNLSFCLFERAWLIRGMEDLLVDMLQDPEFVEEFFKALTEYNLKLIDISFEYELDGMFFGDDWGQQHGMMMSPALWRKLIKPCMTKMFQRVKSKGRFVALHSCGNIYEILPDLVEIGLDIYQTVQPEIYDLKNLKKQFGNSLTFWGGISTQGLLPFSSPEEVKRVVKETMDIMGIGGGYIAAPTHTIAKDVPVENVAALIEVFKGQS